jgi:WD40 repeat protein
MIWRSSTAVLALALVVSADVSSSKRRFDPAHSGIVKILGGKGHVYYCCAFSSDGKYLAAGSLQGPVHVFDTHTWEMAFALDGHPGGTWTLAFTPDGRRIASGGQNGEVKVWEIAGRKEIKQMGVHQSMVWGMGFSGDGSRIVSCAMDGTTKVWDINKGEEKVSVQGSHPNSKLAVFSPDGSSFLCAMNDGSMKLYSAKDGAEIRAIETNNMPVTSAVLARDGRTLYGVSMDGALHTWDISTGKQTDQIQAVGRGQQAMAVTLTPDGRYLLVGQGNVVKIFDTKSGKREATWRSHRNAIYSVAVSPDARFVASASAEGALNIWGYKPSALAFSKGGRGYLGVTVQTPAGGQGCEIQQVLAGTAADQAGLQPGDLILKVGDTGVNTFEEAVQAIGSHKEGEEVEFTVERNGKQEKKKIKLGRHPDDQMQQDD